MYQLEDLLIALASLDMSREFGFVHPINRNASPRFRRLANDRSPFQLSLHDRISVDSNQSETDICY